MAVVEIPLTRTEWVTVEDAAAIHRVTVRSVQRWIQSGLIPAVVIGSGNRTAFLLRRSDVKAFVPQPAGNPTGRRGKSKV